MATFITEELCDCADGDLKDRCEQRSALREIHLDAWTTIAAARWRAPSMADQEWCPKARTVYQDFQMEKSKSGVIWAVGGKDFIVEPKLECDSWIWSQKDERGVFRRWENGKCVTCRRVSIKRSGVNRYLDPKEKSLDLLAVLQTLEKIDPDAWGPVVQKSFDLEIFGRLKDMMNEDLDALKISLRRTSKLLDFELRAFSPSESNADLWHVTGAREGIEMKASNKRVVEIPEIFYPWPVEITWQTRTGLMVIEQWERWTLEKLEMRKVKPLEVDLNPLRSKLDLMVIEETLRPIAIDFNTRWP